MTKNQPLVQTAPPIYRIAGDNKQLKRKSLGDFLKMNIDYSKVKKITINAPLKLDCGETLEKFDIAYETYGNLDETKSNAILVFHALSGDQFVTGTNNVTGREGWWNQVVALDYQ